MAATVPTYAIIHTESGMLVGLGASERAAWADAERESRAAHIDLDREEYECRESEVGKAWRASSTGGLTVAEEYDVAAATLGRKGGQAKSAAKTAAARENAKRAGRPNSWPGAEDGERWMRILIESGACAGTEAWQLTRDGELGGLFDDDGERLEVGNASWRGRRSAAAPGWL